jgi:hypothetical protein
VAQGDRECRRGPDGSDRIVIEIQSFLEESAVR